MSGHLVSYKVLLTHCRHWMRSNLQQATVTSRRLAAKLKPFGWKLGRDSSARGLIAPSHAEAVAIFEKRLGCKIFG